MKQLTFTDIEYAGRRRKTKREEFLDKMDEIIPWQEWVEMIKPYYPAGKRDEEIKKDEHLSKVEYKIAKRPSALKTKISNGGAVSLR